MWVTRRIPRSYRKPRKLSFEVIILWTVSWAEKRGLCSSCSITILQCLHPAFLPGLRGDLWASWLGVRLAQSLWLGLCWASFTRWPDQKPLESRDYATAVDEWPGLCLANNYFLMYSESKAKPLKVQKELIDMPCNVIMNFVHFLLFLEMDSNKC